MLEFSSISVSSYDAASLADQLTAKSADGWDVVAIVPAGTNVTAYLSREVSAGTGDVTASEASEPSDDIAFSFGGDASASGTSTPESTAAAAALGETREPAGWGTAPAEASGSAETPASETAGAGESATAAVTSPSSTVDVAPVADSSGSEPWSSSAGSAPASQEPPAQQQTAQHETAAAAPAGWYADPAGRYELRYWDGTQWTEHVSRAGQQYTDPPVA